MTTRNYVSLSDPVSSHPVWADDALDEDLSLLAATPSESGPSEDQSEIEPPAAAGSQEAWTQPKAPVSQDHLPWPAMAWTGLSPAPPP